LDFSGFEEVEDMLGHAKRSQHAPGMSQLGTVTGFIEAR
jgi:hypothetical protein